MYTAGSNAAQCTLLSALLSGGGGGGGILAWRIDLSMQQRFGVGPSRGLMQLWYWCWSNRGAVDERGVQWLAQRRVARVSKGPRRRLSLALALV